MMPQLQFKTKFKFNPQLTFNNDGLGGGGSEGNGVIVAAFGSETICLIHLPRKGSEGRQPQVEGGIHADTDAT